MPERYYFVLNYPANPVRLAGASNCIPAWVGLLPSPAPSIFYSAPNGFLFGLSFPVLFAAFKSKAKSRPFFTSSPQPKQVGLVFKPLLHPVLLDGLVWFFCTLFFVPIHFAWNQPCTCSPTCLYVMCLGFMVFNPTFRIPCFYCNPIPMPKMPVRPCPCRACKSAHQGRTFFVFFSKKASTPMGCQSMAPQGGRSALAALHAMAIHGFCPRFTNSCARPSNSSVVLYAEGSAL